MKAENIKVVNEAETFDLVVTEKVIGSLNTNIETIEKFVEKRLDEYRPESYLGDADMAKKDRAELNHAKDAIKKKRIEIIKELMKPYNDFEERCKALEKKIDEASKALDEIVKVKENEEKEKKRQMIELFWKDQKCDVVPLEKVFNPKWLNKTFKTDEILSEMQASVKKIYDNLKTLEKFSADAETLKAHYLMTLNIEETFQYGDELQKQREVAQKEKEERAEREHAEQIEKQKKESWIEASNFEQTQELSNLAEMALAGSTEKPKPKRKEFVITVKCFDEDLLKLKQELNGLGIEYTSIEELNF